MILGFYGSYFLVNVYITLERSTILKWENSLSMPIVNGYIKSPEGDCPIKNPPNRWDISEIDMYIYIYVYI